MPAYLATAPIPVAKTPQPQKKAGVETTFYYPQLDGVRIFAFFVVFICHAGALSTEHLPPLLKPLATLYDKIYLCGWCSLDLFFTLSAFLITSLLLREEQAFESINVRLYLYRRILRIWPFISWLYLSARSPFRLLQAIKSPFSTAVNIGALSQPPLPGA